MSERILRQLEEQILELKGRITSLKEEWVDLQAEALAAEAADVPTVTIDVYDLAALVEWATKGPGAWSCPVYRWPMPARSSWMRGR